MMLLSFRIEVQPPTYNARLLSNVAKRLFPYRLLRPTRTWSIWLLACTMALFFYTKVVATYIIDKLMHDDTEDF